MSAGPATRIWWIATSMSRARDIALWLLLSAALPGTAQAGEAVDLESGAGRRRLGLDRRR